MNVYRISNCRFIDDLTGTGAAAYGGRWNSKGVHILYTAATSSLALLESVVHISNIPLEGYCILTLNIPDNSFQEVMIHDLPANWQQFPPPDILKKWGDDFIKHNKVLALKVPSAIIPEEYNYLLNSNHIDFKKLKVAGKRTITIDERLLKNNRK